MHCLIFKFQINIFYLYVGINLVMILLISLLDLNVKFIDSSLRYDSHSLQFFYFYQIIIEFADDKNCFHQLIVVIGVNKKIFYPCNLDLFEIINLFSLVQFFLYLKLFQLIYGLFFPVLGLDEQLYFNIQLSLSQNNLNLLTVFYMKLFLHLNPEFTFHISELWSSYKYVVHHSLVICTRVD